MIQKRTTPLVVAPDFFDRNWAEYKAGFGEQGSDFWLGLEDMHQITASGTWKLQVRHTTWCYNLNSYCFLVMYFIVFTKSTIIFNLSDIPVGL